MSLVEAVRGPCEFCDGDAAHLEALAATYSSCPVCSRALDDEDDPLPERPRATVRQSDDWPIPTERPRPRDPQPPETDS